MKSTSLLRPVIALSLMLFGAVANAQTPAPSQAPPKLERIEEGSDTPITVTSKPAGDAKINEQRDAQGKVTEVKVTSGGSTYYLKPNGPNGSSLPGDATSGASRGPQWKVMEFDLGGKKKKPPAEDAAEDTPPAK